MIGRYEIITVDEAITPTKRAREYKIYVLKDPRTKSIKYVGQTVESLTVRLNNHKNERGRNNKIMWLKKLKELNLKPIIELLECHDNLNECNKAEIFWIKTLKQIGYNLVNMTEGGKGTVGWRCSEATKRKISLAQKKRCSNIEVRQRMSNAKKNTIPWNKGKTGIYSKETLNLMREVQLAYQKTLTPEKKKQWADFYKIPIVQYDLKGNYIKTWSGAIDVKLKIPFSFTNITACCNGKQKTAYGFTWKKLN